MRLDDVDPNRINLFTEINKIWCTRIRNVKFKRVCSEIVLERKIVRKASQFSFANCLP